MENAAHLTPGAMIDGYRVQEKIYAGGMAVLYRVAPAAGDVACLLKMPRREFGSHPACQAGFDVEQMILGRIAGPHVPRLFASGEGDFGPYLVIEHIAGTSLAEYARRAPLPAEEVARLGASLASAVHDLHRQEVVHHDLKPSHVILRPDGQAALIDFGLAFHGHLPDLVAAETDSSSPAATLGTPAYIAPEQIAGGRGDPRSDLFSIGAILYLLATGRLPFGEPTSLAGLRRRLYFDPLPPRCIRPELPEWLQEIILHCLEVRVEARYATAAQVANDLAGPGQVTLTERSRRLRRPGLMTAGRRWLAALTAPPAKLKPSAHLVLAPHVLVAVDPAYRGEALWQALRDAVQTVIAGERYWRVSCVSVLESSVLTEQDEGAEIMRSLHTQQLVQLHHWAQPLGLPRERLRFHVIEGGDAASRLVEFARLRHADHIVMGARGSSALRRFLGSVSSRVAAEAPCSVTVVRASGSVQMETPD